MLQVNRKTEYAIRVLLSLTHLAPHEKTSGDQLQADTGVPMAFLRRILAELTQAGMLDSSPGRHGGVRLGRDPAQINLRQVLEVMDGPVVLSKCMSEHDTCPYGEKCPLRPAWQRAQDAMLREMEATTIAQLAAELNA
ncbi:MAG: Rrf2 family transcriptional regulator [Anaerolineales bacterium]